jgi:heme exporter protein D
MIWWVYAVGAIVAQYVMRQWLLTWAEKEGGAPLGVGDRLFAAWAAFMMSLAWPLALIVWAVWWLVDRGKILRSPREKREAREDRKARKAQLDLFAAQAGRLVERNEIERGTPDELGAEVKALKELLYGPWPELEPEPASQELLLPEPITITHCPSDCRCPACHELMKQAVVRARKRKAS